MLTLEKLEKRRLKELTEFRDINRMRKALGMILLKKGLIKCVGSCEEHFLSFDTVGNRMCPSCRTNPRDNTYNNFQDAYAIVGAF